MFGIRKAIEETKAFEKERKRIEEEKKRKEKAQKPIVVYHGEYMGGHPMYPERRQITVAIWEKWIVLEEVGEHGENLEIPIEAITKIGNETAERITKTRVLLTGPVIGLLWKKHFTYTVIEYKDGTARAEQCVIVDFGEGVEKVQRLIYELMEETKKQLPQQ